MKKFVSLLLAAMMALMCNLALAEGTPSKTVEDITTVVSTTENRDKAVIIVVEPSEVAQAYIDEMTAALENGSAAPIDLFGEETAAAIAEVVGDTSTLEINEIIPIAVINYTLEDGSVTATFQTITPYSPDQTLAAVITFINGQETEEMVLEAKANEDGTVTVRFPVEVMAKFLEAENTLLTILNTK